jgi:4-hydroxybenzoate polyprenyltransferase
VSLFLTIISFVFYLLINVGLSSGRGSPPIALFSLLIPLICSITSSIYINTKWGKLVMIFNWLIFIYCLFYSFERVTWSVAFKNFSNSVCEFSHN